jgi:hypothetical protein
MLDCLIRALNSPKGFKTETLEMGLVMGLEKGLAMGIGDGGGTRMGQAEVGLMFGSLSLSPPPFLSLSHTMLLEEKGE